MRPRLFIDEHQRAALYVVQSELVGEFYAGAEERLARGYLSTPPREAPVRCRVEQTCGDYARCGAVQSL